MSSLATPARSSAEITRRMWAAFSASAPFAVVPSVSCPKVNVAVSGTTLAVAVPSTVTVRVLGSELPCAAPGRVTATATAAASAAAKAAIEIVFIVSSWFAYELGTPPANAYVTSRGGGGVLAEAVQVLLPPVRDSRRGEMDEEHGRGRAR